MLADYVLHDQLLLRAGLTQVLNHFQVVSPSDPLSHPISLTRQTQGSPEGTVTLGKFALLDIFQQSDKGEHHMASVG